MLYCLDSSMFFYANDITIITDLHIVINHDNTVLKMCTVIVHIIPVCDNVNNTI